MKRPKSITVIAWFLIVIGVGSLLSFIQPSMLNVLKQNFLAAVICYGEAICLIISGVMLLKGRNWARYLFVASSAVLILYGFITFPDKTKLYSSILTFGICSLVLFRPNANAYFVKTA